MPRAPSVPWIAPAVNAMAADRSAVGSAPRRRPDGCTGTDDHRPSTFPHGEVECSHESPGRMALSIKSDRADQLARELAAETGESITEAVTIAIEDRLRRARRNRRRMVSDIMQTASEAGALPVLVVENRLGAEGEQKLARLPPEVQRRGGRLTPAMATEAADGFRRYGKGRHPATLDHRRLLHVRRRPVGQCPGVGQRQRLRADRCRDTTVMMSATMC